MAKTKKKDISDWMLRTYCDNSKQIKELTAQQDELKAMFKEVGSVETKNYKMSVSPGSSRQMVGIADVAKAFGVTEAKLEKMGLILKSDYLTVRVTPNKKETKS